VQVTKKNANSNDKCWHQMLLIQVAWSHRINWLIAKIIMLFEKLPSIIDTMTWSHRIN